MAVILSTGNRLFKVSQSRQLLAGLKIGITSATASKPIRTYAGAVNTISEHNKSDGRKIRQFLREIGRPDLAAVPRDLK
jgi:hypothetical protein